MDLGLKGRVALVTGAGSGLGHATATLLAAEGCAVVAVDRDGEAIGALEREDPGVFAAVVADLADASESQRVVDVAVERFDRLDVLVTCAGIFGPGGAGIFADGFRQLDAGDWDRTIDVNLRGTFLTAQAAIAHMVPRRWGRVVTIGSVTAQMGGFLAGADYAASKAGVMGLTRSLAVAAGPYGVTVNCVNPGMVPTAMTRANVPDEVLGTVGDRVPMRRAGRPEDVAAAVAMLASEQAGYITGAHLDVNGGIHFA
jgi:3-oxoacyl-[acyl-carrier protein] reductase